MSIVPHVKKLFPVYAYEIFFCVREPFITPPGRVHQRLPDYAEGQSNGAQASSELVSIYLCYVRRAMW